MTKQHVAYVVFGYSKINVKLKSLIIVDNTCWIL